MLRYITLGQRKRIDEHCHFSVVENCPNDATLHVKIEKGDRCVEFYTCELHDAYEVPNGATITKTDLKTGKTRVLEVGRHGTKQR